MFPVNGKTRVTVVSGATYTGLYAPDGSINVVQASGQRGIYHPCGALLISDTADIGVYTASGNYNVSSSQLSDTTNDFLLEDGSGFILLESGSKLTQEA